MIKKRLRLLIVFFFFFIAACGNTEVQPEPTLNFVPSTTPSPEPTNTVEPTLTPSITATFSPTATSAPTPTATLAPTSTPQVGEARINPDTGQEEVFADTGEWVELPEKWDEQENPETGQTEVWDGSRWSQVVNNHAVIDGQLFVRQETEWKSVNFNQDIRGDLESGLLEIDHLELFDQAGVQGVGVFDSQGRMVIGWNNFTQNYEQTWHERIYNGELIQIGVQPNTEMVEMFDQAEVVERLSGMGRVIIPNLQGRVDVKDPNAYRNSSGLVEVGFYSPENDYQYSMSIPFIRNLLPYEYSREIWNITASDGQAMELNAIRVRVAYVLGGEETQKEGEFIFHGSIDRDGVRNEDIGKLVLEEVFSGEFSVRVESVLNDDNGQELEEFYRHLSDVNFPFYKSSLSIGTTVEDSEILNLLMNGNFSMGSIGSNAYPSSIWTFGS